MGLNRGSPQAGLCGVAAGQVVGLGCGDVSVCPQQLHQGSACVTAGCASVVMRVHGMCEAAAHLLEAFGCCSLGSLYVTVICQK